MRPGDIVALYGDLGSGKTTFVKGIIEEFNAELVREVQSPTFSFLHIYPTQPPIYHFDLYRLPRLEEFFLAGFDEYFAAGGICCIEWPDQIASCLPAHTYHIHLDYTGKKMRNMKIVTL